MKKIALFLSLTLIIISTSCETSNFAFSGNMGLSTAKTENGKSKSYELGIHGSPDSQGVDGNYKTSNTSEDGTKSNEAEVGLGLTRERKQ